MTCASIASARAGDTETSGCALPSGQIARVTGHRLGAGSTSATVMTRSADGESRADFTLAGLVLPAAAGEDGRRALDRVLAALSGQNVTVAELDAHPDRHGRRPALLTLATGETLQIALLKDGLMIGDGTALPCASLFLHGETQARIEKHGVWRHSELLTATGSATIPDLPDFVILRGRVHSVGIAGRSAYLNFGGDFRQDTTIRLTAAVLTDLAGRRLEPGALRGHMIEARGWTIERDGPFMTIDTPVALRLADSDEGN